MSNLPKDIRSVISQYIRNPDQPQFSVNLTVCCQNPTNFELSSLIEDIMIGGRRDTIRIDFNGEKQILVDARFNELSGWNSDGIKTQLSNRREILDFMGTSQLDTTNSSNWPLVFEIFSRRLSCKTDGINPFVCYIQFIRNNLTIPESNDQEYVNNNTLEPIEEILTDEARDRLFESYSKNKSKLLVREPGKSWSIIDIPRYMTWLDQFVSQLQPEDLR